MNTIYLDNNATTRVAPEVFEAMLPYLTEFYGNPSSVHHVGTRAAVAIKDARGQTAEFVAAREAEIFFTGCGTESNNAAIIGVAQANPDKRHIITARTEHPSVLATCQHLESIGYEVTYLSVDDEGQLYLEELSDMLRDDTAIVSLMHANNETGVVFPIDRIAEIVKGRNVTLHVDAVQAAGKLPIDMANSEIDLLSISGHKLHAPKGVGVLYVRRGTRINPLIHGGGQEKGRRSGTENVAGIVAMGKAFELASTYLPTIDDTRKLRDYLEHSILDGIVNTTRNGVAELRLPNTSNINFVGLEGEAILLLLDEVGICASAGSACTTGAVEASHVLKAMNVPVEQAHGSLRFSLSRYTTREEIDRVLDELPPIIQRLTNLSAAG